ncbi:nuclear envelope integral membrane protein 1 isoform X1 [Diprion similis]|uniref:nuclear envelope integral membrane protein 1 isoform X1 n=2 Tax=Diprion similis TaxID=362088 RepID=UPI001EF82D31|nr:nuclear envelope integral membrane protein 1 isoform X1 [Diprion similis]
MRTFIPEFFLICVICTLTETQAELRGTVTYMEDGDNIVKEVRGLHIYCYRGRPKYLIHIWQTVLMNLDVNGESYSQYDGNMPAEVVKKFEEHRSSWSINFFSRKKKEIKLNPFQQSCIGIDTSHEYRISVKLIGIDFWKVTLLILGILVFLLAKKLSYDPIFYYICGITLGITTSLLVFIYLISRLLPKGKSMYLLAAGGWTVSIYLGQLLWENARMIVMQYREYVIWYIVISSLVSFIVCYRLGPVTNKRTKKIIQWFLQASSLLMIYCSSYFDEAAVGICILLILGYNFPHALMQKGKSYWRARFPKRRKLLTEDEYHEEGVRETEVALSSLREFCSSPECNQWKTVLRLKDPIRFANFMEGNSHLADDEVLQYETETTRLLEECEYTDDEGGLILTDSD